MFKTLAELAGDALGAVGDAASSASRYLKGQPRDGIASTHGKIRARIEYRAAVHEAGHAVAAWCGHPYVVRISKITIDDGSMGEGRVEYATTKGRNGKLEADRVWCDIVVSLGGIAAEMVEFNRMRSGPAKSDLEQARQSVAALVSAGAKNPPWDVAEVAAVADGPFDMAKVYRSVSEGSEEARILNLCYDRAKYLVVRNQSLLEKVTESLLQTGVLTGISLVRIFGLRKFHL